MAAWWSRSPDRLGGTAGKSRRSALWTGHEADDDDAPTVDAAPSGGRGPRGDRRSGAGPGRLSAARAGTGAARFRRSDPPAFRDPAPAGERAAILRCASAQPAARRRSQPRGTPSPAGRPAPGARRHATRRARCGRGAHRLAVSGPGAQVTPPADDRGTKPDRSRQALAAVVTLPFDPDRGPTAASPPPPGAVTRRGATRRFAMAIASQNRHHACGT